MGHYYFQSHLTTEWNLNSRIRSLSRVPTACQMETSVCATGVFSHGVSAFTLGPQPHGGFRDFVDRPTPRELFADTFPRPRDRCRRRPLTCARCRPSRSCEQWTRAGQSSKRRHAKMLWNVAVRGNVPAETLSGASDRVATPAIQSKWATNEIWFWRWTTVTASACRAESFVDTDNLRDVDRHDYIF